MHHLPTRSPVVSVSCIEPDGCEHRHFLSTHEFCLLSKIDVVWKGAPATLSFGWCHEGMPVNHAAMALIQAVDEDATPGHPNLLPLRGPVFIGDRRIWFHNFSTVGTEEDLAARIRDVPLRGEVRINLLGLDFEKVVPICYVSCETIADFTLLKMMLSG